MGGAYLACCLLRCVLLLVGLAGCHTRTVVTVGVIDHVIFGGVPFPTGSAGVLEVAPGPVGTKASVPLQTQLPARCTKWSGSTLPPCPLAVWLVRR